jgi:hypothetical protein
MKLFIQYNWVKLILISLTILTFSAFLNTESITYEKEVIEVWVTDHSDSYYYIVEDDNDKTSILNSNSKYSLGDLVEYSDINIYSIIFIMVSIFLFIFTFTSFLDKYGHWEGIRLNDIKSELFMKKVKTHTNPSDNSTSFIYKNRIFYTSSINNPPSNRYLYNDYKSQNINDLPIFINHSKVIKGDNDLTKDKVKQIMEIIGED